MELSFIWVKEFRNFTEGGFNFSTEVTFKYAPETNELTVKPNSRHITKFFKENIVNITGIIGKNGAGKTNLLELINYALNEANSKITSPFFVVFKNSRKFIGYYHGMEMPITTEIKFSRYEGEIIEIAPIYFSNTFDGRNHNFPKRTIALTTNSFLENIFRENIHISYQRDIVNQLRFVAGKNYKYLTEADAILNPGKTENITPDRLTLTSPTWGNIIFRVKKYQEQITEIYPSDNNSFAEFVANYRRQISKHDSREGLASFFGFLTMLDFMINEFRILEPKSEEERKAFEKKHGRKRKPLRNEYKLFEFKKYTKSDLPEINYYLFHTFPKIIDEHFPYQFERSKFMFELPQYFKVKYKRIDEGKYSNRKIQYETDFNSNISRLIYHYFEVTTQLNLNINIDWVGMSSGHKAFINLFGRFQGLISENKIKQQNMLICLDEGDLYFHPKWQTEFLYKVEYVLSKMFEGKKIQIILTTHSPFLVSDLPKDNLLFLEKTNSNTCRVIPTEELQFETFGGNILDLYINSFFLKGNTISAVAAEKIKTLIKFIQEKGKLDEYQQKIYDILGDDFIKAKLDSFLEHDKNPRNN